MDAGWQGGKRVGNKDAHRISDAKQESASEHRVGWEVRSRCSPSLE